jgi:hypothetical protein
VGIISYLEGEFLMRHFLVSKEGIFLVNLMKKAIYRLFNIISIDWLKDNARDIDKALILAYESRYFISSKLKIESLFGFRKAKTPIDLLPERSGI